MVKGGGMDMDKLQEAFTAALEARNLLRLADAFHHGEPGTAEIVSGVHAAEEKLNTVVRNLDEAISQGVS
jgi:hypothetical protein